MMKSATTQKKSIDFQEIIQVIEAAPVFPDKKTDLLFKDENDGIYIPEAIQKTLARMAVIQDRERPVFSRPRIALFAGDHAIANNFHEHNTQKTAKEQIRLLAEQDHAINRLCFLANAELRLYELDLDNPAQDFSRGAAAMDQSSALQAMTYGMMAVEPGMDMLVLAAIGQGNDLAGKAFSLAEAEGNKSITVENVSFTGRDKETEDPFVRFCHFASYPMAAMAGAILSARLARIPVLIDSQEGKAVTEFLKQYRQDITDHCFFPRGVVDASEQEREDNLQNIPNECFCSSDITTPYKGIITLSGLQNYVALLPAMHGLHVHMPVSQKNER